MDLGSQPFGGASLRIAVSGATSVASVGFLVVATGASLLTFAGVSPEASKGLAAVSFAGALLAWGVFIISGLAIGGSRRRTWSEILTYSEDDRLWRDALPSRVIALVGVCMVVLLAGMLIGVADMGPGSPEEVDGRYYSNNHGEVTALTEDEYLRAVGAETRMFVTVAGVFLSASAIGAGSRRNRLQMRWSMLSA
ncbi:MAG: hypothetical protein V9F03_07440 [Microthrixaceae bacterium]